MKEAKRKIEFIDGTRFSRAVSAGSKWLIEREKQLDDINVFPVPDSDTGTNMGGTLQLIADTADEAYIASISEASRMIADSALMGARGNSGAILAQFFQGLSEGLENFKKVSPIDFANAAVLASTRSSEAVSKPKEGTILTVIREWAQFLKENAIDCPDFAILLNQSLAVAQESLARTKEQMEVLRKANVVDAGAQGFVYILEGVINYISQGTISRNLWKNSAEEILKASPNHQEFENNDMHYCTECLLIGSDLNHKLIQEALVDAGNSTVVVGSKKNVRVHIHTNNPGNVFRILRDFGDIQQEKIDDIFQQERDVYGENVNHNIVVVTDTCCDLPKEIEDKYNIHKIPLKVNFGKEVFIDEFTITDDEFYQKMASSKEAPKTSQLGMPDCKRMFDWTSKYFINTLAIHMSRALSGSVEMAHRSAAQISPSIKVIDSRSICVGLGVIVEDACKAIESGYDIEKVMKRVEWASNHYQELFTVKNLSYLIQGGRLSASKGFIANLLHLKPLLHVDIRDGSLHPLSNAFGLKGLRKKMIKTIQKKLDPTKKYNFGIGHSNNLEDALWYKKEIESKLNPASIFMTSISATIGSHSGPGTIAIAFLPEESY
jgi:DegV family protein with EDD domain